jgi:hypothetical protein
MEDAAAAAVVGHRLEVEPSEGFIENICSTNLHMDPLFGSRLLIAIQIRGFI